MSDIVPTVNPLLDGLYIPGRTFPLPSRGLFYTGGELAESVVNGEVEVFPLTAADELVLHSPDKLLSGRGAIEIIRRRVPQVLDPMRLLAKDVDYLFACLRLVTFGAEKELEYTHTCPDARAHTYAINLEHIIARAKKIDPTTVGSAYCHQIPSLEAVVHFKPMTYGDALALFQTIALSRSSRTEGDDTQYESIDTQVVNTALVNLIERVNTTTDRDHIAEWVHAIPLNEKMKMQEVAQRFEAWGADLILTTTCKDCGEPVVAPVALNPVSFFS